MEHELGLTALFNDYLAGVANAILGIFGLTATHPERPWENWLVMEILVVAILMVLAAMVRAALSADKPGGLQHTFESVYGFIKDTARDAGVEHSEKFVPYFATIFIFIVSMNLIGIIPAFESPTMFPWVPAGLAIWTFLYYNAAGFKANGIGYIGHYAGPVRFPNFFANVAIILFMFCIETISHFIRPLSLTVRLYGNMFAGEEVTLAFTGLVPFAVPVIFLGLHLFVSLVQAYVFTILAMIYVAGSTSHDH